MSITDDIKRRVKAYLGKRLFDLPLVFPGDPHIRTVIVSDEVRDVVAEPWSDNWEGRRHSYLRGALDIFTEGGCISVSEKPYNKDPDAFLARVDPVKDEIWDIRAIQPLPGIRCLGGFGGKDFFIALTWDYRENILGSDGWRDEIQHTKSEWESLFGTIPRFHGASLNDYLSNFYVV